MDKNFLGLTRTSSFTDLTSENRKVVFGHLTTAGGLVKQYSCEQIFDKNSNIRQVKVSTVITSDGKPQSQKIWTSNFPRVNSASNLWVNNSGLTKSSSVNKLPMPIKNEPCDLRTLNLSGLKISDDSPEHKRQEKLIKIKKHRRSHSSHDDRRNSSSPPKVKQEPVPVPVPRSEPGPRPGLGPGLDDENKINLKLEALKTQSENLDQQKKIRPLIAQEFVNSSPKLTNRWSKSLFFILVVLSAVIISSLVTEFYEQPFNFANASLELTRKIYGQDEAIVQLSEYFQRSSGDFDVVTLVGGTGVGKTYTGNIIKDHFPHRHNIYEYIPPLSNAIQAYSILSALHSNLVVLENLRTQDLKDLVNFVEYFHNQKDRPRVIILAMINPQTVDENLHKSIDLDQSIRSIEAAFSDVNIPIKTIAFRDLEPRVLEACIQEEARNLNIQLTDQQIEEVKKSIMGFQSGCKGAYAKVRLFVKA
ncbi:uncharacterized protein LOC130673660 [Microplitis mediator]|uniref:uncharacterized protein LOC130673660 n=1 Tax=Microplitis mediator TaxID=375433 RepID=UPI0025555A8E|nr:uncharacterized protein LOC130673660 [Microplitis mediator]